MSAADRVAEALRERILDGALAPGERLREVALAAEHDVARHTVRAALRALAAQRLVLVEPNRGASVAALAPAEVVALYELRSALETEALELALERHAGRLPGSVESAVAALERACAARAPRWHVLTRVHGEVHGAIVAAAMSPRIAEAHAALEAETRLFLTHIRPHYTPQRLAAEHRDLIARLPAEGAPLLREHLRAAAALLTVGA